MQTLWGICSLTLTNSNFFHDKSLIISSAKMVMTLLMLISKAFPRMKTLRARVIEWKTSARYFFAIFQNYHNLFTYLVSQLWLTGVNPAQLHWHLSIITLILDRQTSILQYSCDSKNLSMMSILTHWGQDKIAIILQTTFSNVFFLRKYMHFH